MNQPTILSTAASQYFATLIAVHLSVSTIQPVVQKTFGDGERYLRIETDDRMALFGRDIIIVGSTQDDESFNELCRMGVAAAKYGARRIIYVIPFFGYSTMERAVKPGEIVMAKVNARKLSQLPQGDVRNCFLLLDLHTAGLVHYFEGECLRFELYAEQVLTESVCELDLTNFMFASADLGRPLWVETFANKFGTDLALIRKSRDFETTKVVDVIGNVEGRNVIIYDDMIRSALSLIHAADAYLERGALAVYAVASHGAFNDDRAVSRLQYSRLNKVIVTNSHPMTSHPCVAGSSSKFVVKDVSHLFATAILKLIGKEGK